MPSVKVVVDDPRAKEKDVDRKEILTAIAVLVKLLDDGATEALADPANKGCFGVMLAKAQDLQRYAKDALPDNGLDPAHEATMLDCGFTVGELRAAFDAVQGVKHWKDPISALVTQEALSKTINAIIFFTGTESKSTEQPMLVNGQKVYRVESVGYRNGPAGP